MAPPPSLEAKIGARDVARPAQAGIHEATERNKHRRRFANHVPAAAPMLRKLAIRRRRRLDDPAKGVGPSAVPKARKGPHVPWTDAAADGWRARPGPLPRRIFELGVGSVRHDLHALRHRGVMALARAGRTDDGIGAMVVRHAGGARRVTLARRARGKRRRTERARNGHPMPGAMPLDPPPRRT